MFIDDFGELFLWFDSTPRLLIITGYNTNSQYNNAPGFNFLIALYSGAIASIIVKPVNLGADLDGYDEVFTLSSRTSWYCTKTGQIQGDKQLNANNIRYYYFSIY